MAPQNTSPDSGYEGSAYDSSLESPSTPQTPASTVVETAPRRRRLSFSHRKTLFVLNGAVLLLIIVIGGVSYFLTSGSKPTGPTSSQKAANATNYAVSSLPVKNVKASQELQVGEADQLTINGQVIVGNTLVVSPTATPTNPTTGQIYYDQSTNAPYYYNGTRFVSLAPVTVPNVTIPQLVNSIGGTSGTIGVGSGLQVAGGQLGLQLQAGRGIAVNGSAISNSGVVSLAAGSSNLTITQDGSGNYTVSDSTLGLISGSGTVGQIPLFNTGQSLADSILSQSGSSLTAAGSLTVTGSILSNTLQQTAAGNDLNISAGNDSLVLTAGGRTFEFPTSGPSSQVICTTGISCASGGGQAVILQPGSAQLDTGSSSSIFINNTGGGNLLELQGAGSDKLVVTNAGNATLTGTLAVQGASTTVGTASQQGSLILNDGNGGSNKTATLQGVTNLGQNTTYTLPDPGQATATICLSTNNCTAVGTAGGDLTGSYPNPTIAKLQGNTLTISSPSSGQILQYNGSAFVNQALTGDVTINGSGITAIGAGKVTNADLVNNSLTVTAGTGLSGGGSVALGSASTGLSVNYGSVASTAVQGNTTLVCPAGSGNLTGGGNTITLGAGGSCNSLTVINSPSFSGTLTVQGSSVTIGNPGSTAGVLNLANATNTNLSVLQVAAPTGTGTATYTLPSIAGGNSANICLDTGNCAGTGGGIVGSGSTGVIAKFNSTGSITTSTLSESGSTLTASGNLIIQGSNSLSLGTSSSANGSISFADSLGGHTVTLQAPSSDPASNLVFKLPSSYGSNGNCLQSDGSGGLVFTSCTGGAGGGVTSLDGQTGLVTLNNSSGSGSTVTINNAKADGSTEGIATFNSTNFADNGSGVINTIQNIAVGSAPTFSALTLQGTNALTLGTASANTGAIVFQGSGGAGTLTLQGPTTPNTGDYTLSIPTITANDTICTNGTLATACSNYAPSTGGNYIAKNTNDTSSASYLGDLLGFTNTNTGAAGVLDINNSGTNSALYVTQNGTSEPAANRALIRANNLTTTPSGNLLDLATNSVSQFHVDYAGNVTALGTYNGQTLSSSASLTGTLALATLGSATNDSYLCYNGSSQIASCNITGNGAAFVQGGNSFGAQAVLGTNDSNSLALETNGANRVILDTSGNLTFQQASTISTTTGNTLTIQGGSGTVSLGTSTALSNTSGNLTVTGAAALNLKSTSTNAVTLDSGTTGTVNVGTGANSKTIQIGASNTGSITDTINIGTNTGSSSVNNVKIGSLLGASTTTIQGGTGGIILKSGATSTTALQIQNSSAAALFDVDTTNTRVGIGTASPGYSLDVVGDINASGTLKVGGLTACSVVSGVATCAAAGGGGNYIQNNSGPAQIADFDIQGTAVGQVVGTIEGASGQTADLLDVENGSGNKVVTIGSTGVFTVQSATGIAALSVDNTNFLTTLQAGTDTATLGSNLTPDQNMGDANWTSTGTPAWTTTTTSATNNSGNTTALSTSQFTPVSTTQYQVCYTFSGSPSVGTIVVSMGGVSIPTYTFTGNGSEENFTDCPIVTATNGNVLKFTPSSTFLGTISNVSVQTIVAIPPTLVVVNAADGGSTANLQVTASSSTSNTYIGLASGDVNSTGTNNTSLGTDALQNATTANNNTAIGTSALQNTTTAKGNTAVGSLALKADTYGTSNTAVGYDALTANTSGSQNTAVGNFSLVDTTSGYFNTAIGTSALFDNTTGTLNTAVGYDALSSEVNAGDDVAVGYRALSSATGVDNTGLGTNSGYTNTPANAITTGTNNTFIGYEAGPGQGNYQINNSTAIGQDAIVNQSNAVILGCTTNAAYANSCSTPATVGIGSAYAPNTLTVSPSVYGINGTAGSGSTISENSGTGVITGSSTNFTPAMVGGTIYYNDNTTGTISAYTSATSLTATPAKNVSSTANYTIVYGGFNVTSTGTGYLQPTTDSTTAFKVQNAANTTTVFDVDTMDSEVGIDQTPSPGGAALQVTGGITATTGNLNISAGTIQTAGTSRIDNSGNLVNIGNFTAAAGSTFMTTGTNGFTFEPGTDNSTAFRIVQNTSSAALFTADTSGMVITVSGTTSSFASLTLTNAHFKSTQTTKPTSGTPANCGGGTGPSSVVTNGSTDSAGSFTITAGSTGSPTTCDTVITFNKAYGGGVTPPKSVIITPTTTVGGATNQQAAYVSAISPTTFTVTVNTNLTGNTPTNGEVFSFYYWVVE